MALSGYLFDAIVLLSIEIPGITGYGVPRKQLKYSIIEGFK